MLQHERLDVYTRALELLSHVRTIALDRLPRGSRTLAQRILSSCSSLVIDIASAAGQPSVGAQRRAYGTAVHAATKCAAILDVLRRLALIGEDEHLAAKKIVERVVAGLRRRIRHLEADRRSEPIPRKHAMPSNAIAVTSGETKAATSVTSASSEGGDRQRADENGARGTVAERQHQEPLLNAPRCSELVMQT